MPTSCTQSGCKDLNGPFLNLFGDFIQIVPNRVCKRGSLALSHGDYYLAAAISVYVSLPLDINGKSSLQLAASLPLFTELPTSSVLGNSETSGIKLSRSFTLSRPREFITPLNGAHVPIRVTGWVPADTAQGSTARVG